MKVNLKNQNGMIKQCKVGFSWTTLFFGLFVPLFRGDWKWFLIFIIASCLTFCISNIVFCFIYNKIYINSLLEKGYAPASEADRAILVQKGFLAANDMASV